MDAMITFCVSYFRTDKTQCVIQVWPRIGIQVGTMREIADAVATYAQWMFVLGIAMRKQSNRAILEKLRSAWHGRLQFVSLASLAYRIPSIATLERTE